MVENGPKDALSAGWCGERAIVGPVVLGVELATEERGEVDLDLVNKLVINGLVDSVKGLDELLEEYVFYGALCLIKEDTKDGVLSFAVCVSASMNIVHFKVLVLSINSVLRWGMEMELSGLPLVRCSILFLSCEFRGCLPRFPGKFDLLGDLVLVTDRGCRFSVAKELDFHAILLLGFRQIDRALLFSSAAYILGCGGISVCGSCAPSFTTILVVVDPGSSRESGGGECASSDE